MSKRTSSHFQPGDRQRGAEYKNNGRVELAVEATRALARVEGARRRVYGVGIDWSKVESDRTLHAFCQCQRFAGGKPCKHIWATLLTLAELGPDKQAPGKDRLSLRKDRPARWRDLDGIGEKDGGLERMPRPSRHAHHGLDRRRPHADDHRAGGPSWRSQLAAIRDEIERPAPRPAAPAPGLAASNVRFLVNTAASLDVGGLVLDVFEPKSGTSGRLRQASLDPEELGEVLLPTGTPESGDEGLTVIAALPAEPPARRPRRSQGKADAARIRRFLLPPELYDQALTHLCAQGVLGWWDGRQQGELQPLQWDGGLPWHLVLRLELVAPGARLRGFFERGSEKVPLKDASLILPGSAPSVAAEGNGSGADEAADGQALVVFRESIARLETLGERDLPWIALLRDKGDLVVPKDDLEEALTALLELPSMPRFETPEELVLSEETKAPRPRLALTPAPGLPWMKLPLLADLSFMYDELQVSASDPRPAIVDWSGRKFLRRDMDGEHQALVRLLELGLRPVTSGQGHELELHPQELPAVAEPLLHDGWEVEAHGTSLRPPNPPSMRVESGVDWFEVSGSVDFDGDLVELQKILEAVSKGDRFVELGDGSKGVLPAEWMETYDSLAKLSQSSSETGLRFLPSQALLVDALLTMMPPDVDRAFADLRLKLQSFESIKPKKEPRGFQGTLRGYQRDGLGWLGFLREFGLGGVLADDMGLGKTVQVLALIRANRTASTTTGLPFLVVAPRSLVYNWIDEANRFTPKLKVVEYHGADREDLREELDLYDIVVTTYGTMRRDVSFLATVEFDTVILDEAQAIKNPTSQTAKASGLLVARHRLALTGTPIENHLGELGSIFEFLNPGLLGRLPRLEALATGRNVSREELQVVAEGIRPFILRRTKAQVLPDLPPKTEQVLHCTLRPPQRELYDKLRAGYQASLLKQVETKGMGGSTMQVLEALLRLRQVACHPALVDESWEEAGSAKLEALFEQVAEVLDEGHKVLVFSQFTKLLAYVRAHLDAEEVEYAYLDGQTKKRGELVERFQNDPDCNLFLISLKAGGTGLNLTAAGYVFLLDPWWNPAVEAQAIDRAHRIGQTQPVFAYRMIAQGTVEEKIVDLQRSKRQIADAILDGGDGQTLRDLTADDLKLLLS